MAGKRGGKLSNEVIDEMIVYLNKEEKMTEDISDLLLSLKTDESLSKDDKKTNNNQENELFDIKKLNNIEDKMIRGTAKKIYMSGKRSNLGSNEIIDNIIRQLTDLDKMNDDLLKLLKGMI